MNTVVSLVMLNDEQRDTNLLREFTDNGTLSQNCNAVQTATRRKRGRPKKGLNTNMTPTTSPTVEAPKFSPVTRTVFDLQTFDDVKLSKPFVAPTEPKTLEDALKAVGNDQSKLLSIIYKGLVSEERDRQYNDISGFLAEGEDGTSVPYAGQFADESQGKLINGAILTMAKLQAGGSWDTLSKEKKAALKESAANFIRSNPAMLASFAPAAPVPAAPATV